MLINHDVLNQFADLFPGNLGSAQKLLGLSADDFQKYVSCKKCSSIYTYQDSSHMERNMRVSQKCSYVMFPNHPQRRFRKTCDFTLMKSVYSIITY